MRRADVEAGIAQGAQRSRRESNRVCGGASTGRAARGRRRSRREQVVKNRGNLRRKPPDHEREPPFSFSAGAREPFRRQTENSSLRCAPSSGGARSIANPLLAPPMANILLLDDNEVAGRAMDGILARGGHAGFVAKTVDDAWRMLREGVMFDLVFLELRLAGGGASPPAAVAGRLAAEDRARGGLHLRGGRPAGEEGPRVEGGRTT